MLSRERWLLAGQSLLRALRAFQPHHFKRRAIKMVNSPQLGMIEWQCPDTSAQPHIRMWSMSQQHHYHFHSLLGMQTLELFPKYPKSESEKHYFSKKHNRETPLEQHLQSDLLSQVSSSFRSQLLAEPLASQPSFKHLPLINWPTVWNEHLLFFFFLFRIHSLLVQLILNFVWENSFSHSQSMYFGWDLSWFWPRLAN